MAYHRKKMGEILKEMGLVNDEQIEDALAAQSLDPTKKIAQIFMKRGLITPVHIGEALMRQWEDRVTAYEGRSLVNEGIRSLLGNPSDIFDLQRKLVDVMSEIEELKGDLHALYEVSLAIAKDKALGSK